MLNVIFSFITFYRIISYLVIKIYNRSENRKLNGLGVKSSNDFYVKIFGYRMVLPILDSI